MLKHTHRTLFFNAEGAAGGGAASGSILDLAGSAGAGGESKPDAGGGQGPGSAAATAGYVGDDGAFSEGWIDRLGDDFKDSRGTLEKFKTLPDALKSYVELEKKIGAKGVILPTDKSTPEELSAFRKAMGIPEKPEDYGLKPEAIPDGLTWNDDLAGQFSGLMHKHNISGAAGKELAGLFTTWQEGTLKAAVDASKANASAGLQNLQKEWGDKFSENLNSVFLVAQKLGVDKSTPGFGDPAVVRAFAKMASMVSESTFKGSDGGGGGQVFDGPGDEAKDIQTNPKNPLHDKYMKGDEAAVKRVRDLLIASAQAK